MLYYNLQRLYLNVANTHRKKEGEKWKTQALMLAKLKMY